MLKCVPNICVYKQFGPDVVATFGLEWGLFMLQCGQNYRDIGATFIEIVSKYFCYIRKVVCENDLFMCSWGAGGGASVA